MGTCDEIKMNGGDVALTTWMEHVQQTDRHVEIVRKLEILKKCVVKKVQNINKPQATPKNDGSDNYDPFFCRHSETNMYCYYT